MRRSEQLATTQLIDRSGKKEPVTYRIRAVASMLGVSDQSIRSYEKETGITVERAKGKGPAARIFSVENVFALAAYRRRKAPPPSPSRPMVLTVYTRKGGVGKTVIAGELGIQYQLMGYRVLIVDVDGQANLTMMYGYDPEADSSDPEAKDSAVDYNFGHLFELPPLFPKPVPFRQVVKMPFGEHGPHLIPADVYLANLEHSLIHASNRDYKVLNLITRGVEEPTKALDLTVYDMIIFDAAPATSTLTNNVLLASHVCVAPVRLDMFSFKGLSSLNASVRTMQKEFRASPHIRIVPTFYHKGRKRVQDTLDRLEQEYRQHLTDCMIRDTEDISRSMTYRHMPVSLSNPMSDVVRQDFHDLALELLSQWDIRHG